MKFRVSFKMVAIVIALAFGHFNSVAQADLTIASPFTDNAVLQRDIPAPVWGKAKPGSQVTVQFAGQTKVTTTDAEGRWQATLDSLQASAQPRTLSATTADEKLLVENVVVGEVWICSGQSNMQMGVTAVPAIKALLPTAKNIRRFKVKRTVALTEQDTCTGEWLPQPPDSAVAFAFAHFLEDSADVPIGIIHASWGSSSLEAWMPRDMTKTVPHFKTMMQEFDADTATRERIQSILNGKKPWSRNDDIFLRRQTNILYNAMIHPLAPYGCRGLVWYQGERNTQSMHGMLKEPWYSRNSGMLKYGDTLKQWVLRLRKEWHSDDMEFLVVMLPGFYKPLPTGPKLDAENPTTHSWAWMRESQLKVLELPNTAVANTIDLGDEKNIHPKDKLPIGRRLALLAARDTLGKNVVANGPIMDRVERQGNKLLVRFENSEGLRTNDEKSPAGFWLADDTQQWVKADAAIDGQWVVLTSDELEKSALRSLRILRKTAGELSQRSRPASVPISHRSLPAVNGLPTAAAEPSFFVVGFARIPLFAA